jgi:hypothetical protein
VRDGLSANVTGKLNFSAGWRSPTVGVEKPKADRLIGERP